MKRFVLCLVFLTPFVARAADYDPTALHDRGNQKLIGNLEVTGTVTAGSTRTTGSHSVDGTILAKNMITTASIVAGTNLTATGSLMANSAVISEDTSIGGNTTVSGSLTANSLTVSGAVSAASIFLGASGCCEEGFICASGYRATLAQKLSLMKIFMDATDLGLQEARALVESGSDGVFGCGITFRAPLGDFSCRETQSSEAGGTTYVSCPFCSLTAHIGRISYADNGLLLCVADATASNGVKKLTIIASATE